MTFEEKMQLTTEKYVENMMKKQQPQIEHSGMQVKSGRSKAAIKRHGMNVANSIESKFAKQQYIATKSKGV